MLDFIIELAVQLVVQFLLNVLAEAGIRGAEAAAGSRTARIVISMGVGFAAGVLWGRHATSIGLAHEPRTLWCRRSRIVARSDHEL